MNNLGGWLRAWQQRQRECWYLGTKYRSPEIAAAMKAVMDSPVVWHAPQMSEQQKRGKPPADAAEGAKL
jgi:hypothetical protein